MRQDALRKILSALVDDCGYDVVRKSLEDLGPGMPDTPTSKDVSAKRLRRPRMKPNAVTTVESLEITDEEKKSILMVLAKKYEKKIFMPNVNYVRAFMEQEGKDSSHIKSRQQVVSAVFKCLADWETKELRELDARGAYDGPKSLSVIAKSIENVGQQNRL